MWQKVATEMGIPWRSAESMHWQLGEQEMSARANAPVFQLHPSATGSGLSSPSQVPVAPVPTMHGGFTPANAAQIMPHPPPMTTQHQPPTSAPHGSYGHQRTDSGSSAGRRRSGSFSRRRADPRSRSSVPPQLSQPLPQIQPNSAEDLISGARTAPTPGMHSGIKREGDGSTFIEPYHKRRRSQEVGGSGRSNLDASNQEIRSPDRQSQHSATGSIKSMKREPEENERPSIIPSPPQASATYSRPPSRVA